MSSRTANIHWKKELWIAAGLLLLGLLGLPASIYFVGAQIIGPYDGGQSLFFLTAAIWRALGSFSPGAWLLVLSPWIVITLCRCALSYWKPPPPAPSDDSE